MSHLRLLAALMMLMGCSQFSNSAPVEAAEAGAGGDYAVRYITVDPGHFHAALVHDNRAADISPQVTIYGQLDGSMVDHLRRLMVFNTRAQNPTDWQVTMYTQPDFFERMLAEKPGNAVVLAGRNRQKINYLEGAVGAGLNLLVDKPWIIRAEDHERLVNVLRTAEAKGLIAYDIMTERNEIASMIQRELIQDGAIYGEHVQGTPEEPGVWMKSIHHISKIVGGAPLRRPVEFFDIHTQGEALADVGTHLIDLTMWKLFPGEAIDYKTDVELIAARRWPTVLTQEQFAQVTGVEQFPEELAPTIRDGKLEYFSNNSVTFALRGVNVKLEILWNWEFPQGDTHNAYYRGTRSRVEVRQTATENWRTELYVVPNDPADLAGVTQAVQARVAALQSRWPGLAAEQGNGQLRIVIPDSARTGHESHFSKVANQFVEYVKNPATLPAWELPNMITKYYITTHGVELARQQQ